MFWEALLKSFVTKKDIKVMTDAIKALTDGITALTTAVNNAAAKAGQASPAEIAAVNSAAQTLAGLATQLNTAFGV